MHGDHVSSAGILELKFTICRTSNDLARCSICRIRQRLQPRTVGLNCRSNLTRLHGSVGLCALCCYGKIRSISNNSLTCG